PMNNSCPSCGAIYNVAAKDIGRRIKCKKCQTALIVTENGLEVDQPVVPAAAAAPAAPLFDDEDDGDEVVSTKKGKDRGRRYAGPPGPSLGERLEKVGGIPTLIMGFGAFLVIVFLFLPIIGSAAVSRADGAVKRKEMEQQAKINK